MPALIPPSVNQSRESHRRGEVNTSFASSRTRYQYFLSKISSTGAVNGGSGLSGLTPGSVTGVVLGASGAVTSGEESGLATTPAALQKSAATVASKTARPTLFIALAVALQDFTD